MRGPAQLRPKAAARPSGGVPLDLPMAPSGDRPPPSQQHQQNQQNHSAQQQATQPNSQQPAQQQAQQQQQQSHLQAPSQQQQSHSAAPSPMMPQTGPQQHQQPQMNQQMMQQQMLQQQQMMAMQQQTMPMPMAPMGMHHMPQGQMMMQAQMQPMQSQAPQQAAQATPAPQKSKGIKLKNAPILREGVQRKEHTEDDKAGDKGDKAPGKVEQARSPIPPVTAPAVVPEGKSNRLSLRPDNFQFDRVLMLRIWRSHRYELHTAVQGLHTNLRPGEKGSSQPAPQGTPVDKRAGRVGGRGGRDSEPSDRSAIFGIDMKQGKKNQKPANEPLLKVSERGYRITEPTKREDELERRVRGLLNKICPDNLKTIVDRLAEIELHKADELEFVIKIIFGKALAEPHYCETYADMVFALRSRYPEFPPEREGERPQTFTRVLLNTCQEEFETLPTSFDPSEEEKGKYSADDLQLEMKKRKDKILANMKFIGNLFLRQLLAVKVIGQVVHDLVGIKESSPEEHMIECVCELLQAIGYTMDQSSAGKVLMSQFAARLLDLKRLSDKDGRAQYSKRIQFQIQGLLELRQNGWEKKLWKDKPKSKEEVRKDAAAEAKKAAKGGGVDVLFSTQIAGARPSYIDASKGPGQGQRQRRAGEVVWDQAYVKRICQYFADDRNGEELADNWHKATPNSTQAKQGLEWLLDIGFSDKGKADIMAETVTELVARRVVSWEHLKDALSPSLEGLEDMVIDIPNCLSFFDFLVARLVLKFGRDFNASILSALNHEGGNDFHWKVLVTAIKKCQEFGGHQGVSKALEHKELEQMLCKARRCTEGELKAALREVGL